ncbi:MAG: hypothetical protein ACREJ2_16605 [Planctomycetota bacterium]
MPGKLEGHIDPIERVKKIFAIDRSLTQAFIENKVKSREIEGSLDPKTGTYTFASLPAGAYDLKLLLSDGRTVEGCDMRPEKPSVDPLTYADRKAIKTAFENVRQFTDENNLWRIEGNGQYATILVELVRHGQTSLHEKVNGDSFVIWRVELWRYVKEGEAWTNTTSQVLQRMRPSVKDFRTWNWQFSPALGGVTVAPKATTDHDIHVPVAPDLSCGRFSDAYRTANPETASKAPGVACKAVLVDTETGTVVVDAGATQAIADGMEAWIYAADGKTVVAKGKVLRIGADQTTLAVPGLKLTPPPVDPDDPYAHPVVPTLPPALKDLKIGTSVRLVPIQ